jgi:nucleotide-binding universal stress UspA family protein
VHVFANRHGEVTLRGRVHSPGVSEEATQIARTTPGVKLVFNQIATTRSYLPLASTKRLKGSRARGGLTMGYKKILVTLDGSKLAELALQHTIEVAAPGAQIHILSVMAEDRVSEIAALASAMGQSVALSSEQWPPLRTASDPRLVHAREDYLLQVSEWLEQVGMEVTVEVRPGNIVDTIVSVARDGFDVVIMATHGRTGLSRVALGSVAEGVLHHSPCPVLIVPATSVRA